MEKDLAMSACKGMGGPHDHSVEGSNVDPVRTVIPRI